MNDGTIKHQKPHSPATGTVAMSKQETMSYAAEATDAAAAANSLSVAQANINKQTRAATERNKN